MDKYIDSCSALSTLQEIDNARNQQYMDLPHPMYLCCLPNDHFTVPGDIIVTYWYEMSHNPYSMHLSKVTYHKFVNKFSEEHEYLPCWKTIEHCARNYQHII